VALNQTNKKQNKHVFSPKIMLCKLITVSFINISGINQPPVNSIAASVDINTIEQYSPKKKKTKIIELCSVKKPATNSDSASGKSKGVLFVSARIDIKNIMNTGSKGTTNQIDCWLSMILVILKDPVNIITIITAVLKISS
jgi:hypothetical protein